MKEKKRINSNYGILVILLFATVAFLTDYIIIERKIRVCDCPKCEATNNEVISDNKDNTQVTRYSYENISGYYSYSSESATDEWYDKTNYSIYLFTDGTFEIQYFDKDNGGLGGFIGNYILEFNELKLNYLFKIWSNGGIIETYDEFSNLFIDGDVIKGKLNLLGGKSVEILLNKTEYNGNSISGIKYIIENYNIYNSKNRKEN